MEPLLYEQLRELVRVLFWLGKTNEANAIDMIAQWLEINGVRNYANLADILSSCNDNPNLAELLVDDDE